MRENGVKIKKEKPVLPPYEQSLHRLGRITGIAAVLLFLAVPAVICLYFNAWPEMSGLLNGIVAVSSVYLPIGIIEVLNYSPMLGAGGSYLAFISGNLANMKVPAAATAMKAVDVQPGTKEGELISTIAVAVSTIITTVIIILGVLLLVPLTPIITSPDLAPAFDNVLPALFGALGIMLVAKRWYIAVVPLIIMTAVFLLGAPSSMVGLMVPIASVIAIAYARILYKAGKVKK
ncbi:MAG: hypothetical protein ACOYIR_04770 [Christensenellales bacterium]|jgi:hypothetical protein